MVTMRAPPSHSPGPTSRVQPLSPRLRAQPTLPGSEPPLPGSGPSLPGSEPTLLPPLSSPAAPCPPLGSDYLDSRIGNIFPAAKKLLVPSRILNNTKPGDTMFSGLKNNLSCVFGHYIIRGETRLSTPPSPRAPCSCSLHRQSACSPPVYLSPRGPQS